MFPTPSPNASVKTNQNLFSAEARISAKTIPVNIQQIKPIISLIYDLIFTYK